VPRVCSYVSVTFCIIQILTAYTTRSNIMPSSTYPVLESMVNQQFHPYTSFPANIALPPEFAFHSVFCPNILLTSIPDIDQRILVVFIWLSTNFRWRLIAAVGIATGYGLDDRGVGVRVPVRSGLFTFPCRPYGFWGPTQPPSQWVKGALSKGVKLPGG
jgi:hypothetical protein